MKRGEEKIMEASKKEVTRRNFLKGAAASAGVVVSGSILNGCAPRQASTAAPTAAAAGAATEPAAAAGEGGKKYSFETAPAPIADKDIKSKKSADVVVVGAGLAGLCAAYAAADGGAKVIVLEKRETFTFHGMDNAAIGDRFHKAQGVEIPKDEVMADIMRFGGYHPNARLILLWENESGRIMDKLLDMADAEGIKYTIDTYTKEHWPYKEFPTSIEFAPARQATFLPILEKNVKAKNVEILYSTPAVQLIRPDAKGKVTGVIAKGADGYIQVDAAKAVILCAGDYGGNPEMLEKYIPRALKTVQSGYTEGTNTGDGIAMGMWIGAAKQETSCALLWDGWQKGQPMFLTLARQPWLYVNVLGERYANEDAPFGYTANQDIEQPESMKWAVWDANWNTDKDKLHGTVCEHMIPPFWNDKSYETAKSKNQLIEANSLEELADLMQVPKDAFLASVKRYNELVEKGVDEDFGKDPAKLTAIVKAPFGAAKVGTGILVTVDGLKINTDLQVLDTEGKPIAGLYAAGNNSGDFFSNDYPIDVHGLTHGRAFTFGWLAGEKAAKL